MNTLSHTKTHTAGTRFHLAKLNPVRIWAHLNALLIRQESRKALASLPDYLLKDIGVSRAEALNEADKSFWKK